MIPQSKHPDEFHRSRTVRKDEPKDLAERPSSAKNSPSQPMIDAAEQTTTTPWRHPHLICPCCGSSQINRIGRRGVREYLLSVVYIYPFRCESCSHSFRVCEWGVRYRRQRRY